MNNKLKTIIESWNKINKTIKNKTCLKISNLASFQIDYTKYKKIIH